MPDMSEEGSRAAFFKQLGPLRKPQQIGITAGLVPTFDPANTQRSVERGTFGSPTFFVEEDIYFGKDRLRDIEEAITAQRQE